MRVCEREREKERERERERERESERANIRSVIMLAMTSRSPSLAPRGTENKIKFTVKEFALRSRSYPLWIYSASGKSKIL